RSLLWRSRATASLTRGDDGHRSSPNTGRAPHAIPTSAPPPRRLALWMMRLPRDCPDARGPGRARAPDLHRVRDARRSPGVALALAAMAASARGRLGRAARVLRLDVSTDAARELAATARGRAGLLEQLCRALRASGHLSG